MEHFEHNSQCRNHVRYAYHEIAMIGCQLKGYGIPKSSSYLENENIIGLRNL